MTAINQTMVERKPFVSTSHGMSGFFAVLYWWNPEGFYEPWQTGFGRYATKEEAIEEAKQLAEEEGVEYIPSGSSS